MLSKDVSLFYLKLLLCKREEEKKSEDILWEALHKWSSIRSWKYIFRDTLGHVQQILVWIWIFAVKSLKGEWTLYKFYPGGEKGGTGERAL